MHVCGSNSHDVDDDDDDDDDGDGNGDGDDDDDDDDDDNDDEMMMVLAGVETMGKQRMRWGEEPRARERNCHITHPLLH